MASVSMRRDRKAGDGMGVSGWNATPRLWAVGTGSALSFVNLGARRRTPSVACDPCDLEADEKKAGECRPW